MMPRAAAIPSVALTGVELHGLGCSLDEWDAIAASMPPSLRPSVRGAWSPAFERAALAYARASRPSRVCRTPSLPVAVASPSSGYTGRPRSGVAELVRAVLHAHAPLSVGELAAHLPDVRATSVANTLYRLIQAREVERVGPRHRYVGRNSTDRQRYAMAPPPAPGTLAAIPVGERRTCRAVYAAAGRRRDAVVAQLRATEAMTAQALAAALGHRLVDIRNTLYGLMGRGQVVQVHPTQPGRRRRSLLQAYRLVTPQAGRES